MKLLKNVSRGLFATVLSVGLIGAAAADTTTLWSKVITQSQFNGTVNTFELLAAQPNVTSFTVDASGGGATGLFFNPTTGGLNSTWLIGGLTPMPVGPGLTTAGLTVSTAGGTAGSFSWTFGALTPILPVDGVTITGSVTAVSAVPDVPTHASMVFGLALVGGLAISRRRKQA